ncbi:hypothetical protein [Micromonospora auratinigra]|nr:hypothetical protein [Micromonospora auratinigra]
MGDPEDLARRLADAVARSPDCAAEPGLSDEEIDRAEETFALRFPPLWRRVLTLIHPRPRYVAPNPGLTGTGPTCPDWRLRDVATTREMVEAPVEGLLLDVEESAFWWHAWGAAPSALADRLAVARRELARVPRLTPLWGHQYVADTDDSPVFSIVQADLWVPAATLGAMVEDPSGDDGSVAHRRAGRVPFWSDLYAYSQHRGEGSPFGHLATGGL